MGANVLDVYRLGPDKSILDNVWRSKVLRRPVYATSTEGSITQVWRIEAHGALVRIAAINWSARSVAVGEVVKRLEDAVVKSKGFFQSGSHIASIGSTQVKLQAIQGGQWSHQWHEAWLCTILKPRNGTSRSNEEDAFYSAEFVPPQFCLKTSDLRLYGTATTRSGSGSAQRLNPPPRETIDNIVICCILVAAGRDEYKTVQSSSRPSSGEIRTCGTASPLQSNYRNSLAPLPTHSCIEGIHVPYHLMEIQQQLYALNVAAGSAITLPPYQNAGEVHRTLNYGAIDKITTYCPPPAYS